MKAAALFAAVGVLSAVVGFSSQKASAPEWSVIIGGQTDGYLSPCGCTKPMSGGIRRRVSAIRQLATGNALILDSGGLAVGAGPQDEMKADALAEALVSAKADAVLLSGADAVLGVANLSSLTTRLDGRLLSTSVTASDRLPLVPSVAKGPFAVGGVLANPSAFRALGETARDAAEAAEAFVAELSPGAVPVLLTDGGKDAAVDLAEKNPELRLIVFRQTGEPLTAPIKVGKTLLVTVGEQGKHVLRFKLDAGAITEYRAIRLGQEYDDDPKVAVIYQAYLRRVADAGLLEALPRTVTDRYVGSEACLPCHTQEHAIWKGSRHSSALATLEADGHQRDPDCVSCHVVGLDSESGFRSREKTPTLSDVGCESCHGPGERHSREPKRFPFKKVGEDSCTGCHRGSTSPNFDFLTYWKKIQHGPVENQGISSGHEEIKKTR
jgi:hypothetical protein